jgi:hypothetical protein
MVLAFVNFQDDHSVMLSEDQLVRILPVKLIALWLIFNNVSRHKSGIVLRLQRSFLECMSLQKELDTVIVLDISIPFRAVLI